MKKRKLLLALVIAFLALMLLCGTAVLSLNAYVVGIGDMYLRSPEEAAELDGVDCILVLGCHVKDDGTPSDMLMDRITRGVELYMDGAAPKIIMSGDHGRVNYNEVGTMKRYAVSAGVPSDDVFMDHAGFSTYESLYRARDIFGADKVIIVSQKYHLYRAVYIARELGIEAYGVSADYSSYAGQTLRDIREILARCKDFFGTALKPYPTYLGVAIPVWGDGDSTNDDAYIHMMHHSGNRNVNIN